MHIGPFVCAQNENAETDIQSTSAPSMLHGEFVVMLICPLYAAEFAPALARLRPAFAPAPA